MLHGAASQQVVKFHGLDCRHACLVRARLATQPEMDVHVQLPARRGYQCPCPRLILLVGVGLVTPSPLPVKKSTGTTRVGDRGWG
ncbi:hypothetical protein E2C01_006227 [Portunus trituberculatus]|uniref:Uncharacterized protein n=1 Tax=Portunus trituberculatus TaxID=210409 RepID=A0A5B7CVQ8_PORTR|nr:hypothetical protein [Portunus trituberculatus]